MSCRQHSHWRQVPNELAKRRTLQEQGSIEQLNKLAFVTFTTNFGWLNTGNLFLGHISRHLLSINALVRILHTSYEKTDSLNVEISGYTILQGIFNARVVATVQFIISVW